MNQIQTYLKNMKKCREDYKKNFSDKPNGFNGAGYYLEKDGTLVDGPFEDEKMAREAKADYDVESKVGMVVRCYNADGGEMRNFSASIPPVGTIVQLDWDGPSTAKIMNDTGAEITLNRIDKDGNVLTSEEKTLVVSPEEFADMFDKIVE